MGEKGEWWLLLLAGVCPLFLVLSFSFSFSHLPHFLSFSFSFSFLKHTPQKKMQMPRARRRERLRHRLGCQADRRRAPLPSLYRRRPL